MDCYFGDTLQMVQKFLGCKKNIIRIMLGCRSNHSCRNLFKKLKSLPLPSQYIFSLLFFVIRNRNQYTANSKIQHINTKQHSHFHQLQCSLIKYQNGTYYLDIYFYNGLPSYIKDISDSPNRLTSLLKDFLYIKIHISLKWIFSIKQEWILVDFCYNILSVNHLQYTLSIMFLWLGFIFFCIFKFCTAVMFFMW